MIMIRPSSLRQAARPLRSASGSLKRHASSAASSSSSPAAPRHLQSIQDLSAPELSTLVRNAAAYKQAVRSGHGVPERLRQGLAHQTVSMIFNKRSTRTRVSTEAAVAMLGGHPMFLGKDDIQLGVNESLLDTSRVISSMTSCIVARVGPHSDITELSKHSSVPVINALSDDAHPLQTVADLVTMHEVFGSSAGGGASPVVPAGLKVAWVGDSNNVLFDLALGCAKLGVDVAVASPRGYGVPDAVAAGVAEHASRPDAGRGRLTLHESPEEALRGADVVVTDTWVSMGQEEEKKRRLRDFAGFQVTRDLARRGGANPDWKFMHCLPRKPEEVDDDVFYSDRSLVFQEAENRLWAAVAVLDAFVARKGSIE